MADDNNISEVVERLANKCMIIKYAISGRPYLEFDRVKAKKILHEWLDRHLMQVRHDYRTELKKLSNEWREQIIKEIKNGK